MHIPIKTQERIKRNLVPVLPYEEGRRIFTGQVPAALKEQRKAFLDDEAPPSYWI